MTGQLVLVATPIGNLADITLRALEVLRSADVVACEDTRHTRKLLNHFDIKPPSVLAVHEHNEATSAARIVELISGGAVVALVTDAGTPGVSDPGSRVVAAVAEASLVVTTTPGPSAVLAALVVSGLPTDRFVFEGFLPRSGQARHEVLERLALEERTMVLYESPNRLAKTLAELAGALGEQRRVAVAREMTKLHEEITRSTLAELADSLQDQVVKGECVVVIEGQGEVVEVGDSQILALLDEHLSGGNSRKDAVEVVAKALGVNRKRVYGLSIGRPSEP